MVLTLGVVLGGSTIAADLEQEKAKIVEQLLEKARYGDPEAQFSLATAYDSGYGVPQDHSSAAHWYEKAAEQGHAWARFNLGVLNEEGLGVPQNRANALHWYRMAAEAGLAEAQSNLGRLYTEGPIPDYPVALAWFKRASDAGHAEAKFNLAQMHRYGLGTEQDLSKALSLLNEVKADYPPAAQLLQELVASKNSGIENHQQRRNP